MSKAARQRSARERLAEQRAREAARQKRMRGLMISGIAVVVIIAAVVVGVLVANKKSGTSPTDYAGPFAPVAKQADGTYLMAQPGVTGPTLDMYEDLQCPICKQFEAGNGSSVEQLAYQGKVKVIYHIVGFVNPTGSIRAAVAAGCAADAGKFVEFHNVAYRKQQSETEALTVATLKDFGKQAGISGGSFDQCVAAQAGAAQAQTFTKNSLDYLQKATGSAGTPTVFLNGQSININTLLTAGSMKSIIQSAPAGSAPASAAPSAAPSASGSAAPSASASPTK